MTANGPSKATISVTLDRATGQVSVTGPLDNPEACLQLLQAGVTQMFRLVAQGKGRKVKTLDELGVNPNRGRT